MRNLFSLIAITLFLSFSTGVILAQPGQGRGMNKNKAVNLLKLTDEQKEKIETLRANHMKEVIDIKSDLQKAMLDKKEIVRKGNIDRKGFVAVQEKISELTKKMSLKKANHQMDVYALFTAEQKEIAAKHPFMFQGQKHKMQEGRPMCPNCAQKGMHRRGMPTQCKPVVVPVK